MFCARTFPLVSPLFSAGGAFHAAATEEEEEEALLRLLALTLSLSSGCNHCGLTR